MRFSCAGLASEACVCKKLLCVKVPTSKSSFVCGRCFVCISSLCVKALCVCESICAETVSVQKFFGVTASLCAVCVFVCERLCVEKHLCLKASAAACEGTSA